MRSSDGQHGIDTDIVVKALAEVYRQHATKMPDAARGCAAVAQRLGLTDLLRKELGLS